MEKLALVLLVTLVCGLILNWIFRRPRRSTLPTQAPDVTDARQQLSFVSQTAFERQPLLNKSEFPILMLLEDVVHEVAAGHRVMAQTNLGEFLRPQTTTAVSDLARRSINSKRVDFVVIDRTGMPVLAVEYQGHGHYRGNAKLRDAVKREALRSAGVALVEVTARFDRAAVASQFRACLAPVRPGARSS